MQVKEQRHHAELSQPRAWGFILERAQEYLVECKVHYQLQAQLRFCGGYAVCHMPASKPSLAVRPRSAMLIDPLVIGEFETVPDGPMAFSSVSLLYTPQAPRP